MLIKAGSAALALALAATLGMVPTAPAWADQTSSENSAIEQPGSVGDDDATGDATEQGEEVFVYLRLDNELAAIAGDMGLELNETNQWYTIGVIRLAIDSAADKNIDDRIDLDEDMQAAIAEALGSIVRFPDNEAIDIANVEWTDLKVCNGATDYADRDGYTWHLDGKLAAKADPEPDPAPDEPVVPPTPPVITPPFGGVTDPIVPDEPIDEPGQGDEGDDPVVPDEPASGETPEAPNPKPETKPDFSVPTINFTMPAGNRTDNRVNAPAPTPAAAAAATPAPTSAATGFSAGETTAVAASEPKAEAEPEAADGAVATMVIQDDAVPMTARTGEAIPEEEVPMGAFDAPVDPAPWVAGLGALGTALWGVIAVRRRLMMTQRLAAFESQVLGATEAEAETVVASNAQHVL